LQEGGEIPAKYRDILIGKEDAPKEYELTYAGKAREEDIIADTLAAPLQEVRTFNSDNKFDDGWTNKLIFGDNLMALKNLYEDPKIKGKVKLIYIDPPFAVNKEFSGNKEQKAYRDKIIGAKFVEFLRKRLIFLRELLHTNGSIYIHLDEKKSHYAKIICDEIFGEHKFQREIIWRIGWISGYKSAAKNWIRNHDTIFFYTNDPNPNGFTFNKEYIEYPKDYLRRDGSKPEGRGYPIEDTWNCNELDELNSIQIMSFSGEKTGFPTQKNENLLARIIQASSNKGDIVLDAFAGSGTTLAVAEKLKRKWIGIDCGKLAIYTMQKRMLNLKEEIGNKGKSLKAKAFTLYNAGLYDWAEVKKLDFGHYRDFVLKLFQVREEKHTVRGIEIDGYIGNENAYLWNHTKEKRAKLDLDFVKSLHNALSGKGGEVFYIIAPTNAFVFYEDEIKHDDTTYKTLRVPQSVITELIKRGGDTIKQPTSEQDVNDTIDAVGFDFIQVPQVETEYKISNSKEKTLLNQKTKECVIKIKTFKSKTLTKSPEEFENYETLSMVMVDYNYDGKVFDLDEVFYADKLKPDYEVRFDSGKLDKQMMVIYLDIYGNEKKEILSLQDFKK
jgi:site-specific DNA-methyltransferase (adenine-specific)/adenine-specific DNA-methyltransferase